MWFLPSMELRPEVCYSAIKSRDRRFDGRFFAAVVTTGVYCRPVCPAPLPKRANVRFFPCAAAAEEAGFRPCRRCRPEASPGTPAWVGTSTTVARALRLISEGSLDDAGVDELAAKLGMGARHLRRLFLEHLGATPVAVAQTRRVHFAKTLLDNTNLPVTEVALAAGFSSIRRFNDAFKKTFSRTPTDVRTRAHRVTAPAGNGGLELKLAYRPPLDWRAILGFLGDRAIPGVEAVDGTVYRRTAVIGDAAGVVEVEAAASEHHLLVRVPSPLSRHAREVVERIRRLFDLKADPAEIAAHLGRDRVLGAIVKRYPGLRVPGAWDPFETTIRAIAGQQVTVKAATTIAGRLAERYGEPFHETGVHALRYCFPRPERLARARLSRLGMPGSRARTIRRYAKAVTGGDIPLDGSLGLEGITEKLICLDGIGRWTAQYVAMRAYSEPDAFPVGDLVLHRAAAREDETLGTERALIERADAWRPWRAYATLYLWSAYAESLRKKG